jgi:hypothetical protein
VEFPEKHVAPPPDVLIIEFICESYLIPTAAPEKLTVVYGL